MSEPTQSPELWQAFNEQGEPLTARGLPMAEAGQGALHGSVHVWFWRVKQGKLELLLQQRAADSMTWPDYFDASAAGHVDFGETPLTAARRETAEEIGVELAPTDLELFFVHRQRLPAGDTGIIENEIQWVYGVQVKHHVSLQFKDGEVESSRWVDEAVLRHSLAGKGSLAVVPHDNIYFGNVLQELKNRAQGMLVEG